MYVQVLLIGLIFISMYVCFKKLLARSLREAFLLNKEGGFVGARDPAREKIAVLFWRASP